jgi:hypothetical protein
MAELITTESRENIRLPVDLDHFAVRYVTENNLYTFTSPSLWTLEKHLYYLLRNSEQKEFEPKYKMRPDYMSFDEYGTVILAPVLMYVNGVFCIEHFDLSEVVVPSFQSITEILKDKFPREQVTDLPTAHW